MLQDPVAVNGQIEPTARNSPIRILAVTGRDGGIFQPIGRFPLLFDLFSLNVQMVQGNKYLSLGRRSGLGHDIE